MFQLGEAWQHEHEELRNRFEEGEFRFRRKRINRYPFARDNNTGDSSPDHWPELPPERNDFPRGNENPPGRDDASVIESKFETPPFQHSRQGREGLLFRSTLNTDATPFLPNLKGNVCLSVTKFAAYRDNVSIIISKFITPPFILSLPLSVLFLSRND